MQISVRSLAGGVISVGAVPHDTVADLKLKIQDLEGFPACHQRLIFSGSQLEDGRALSDYNINDDTALRLLYFAGDTSPSITRSLSNLSMRSEIAVQETHEEAATELVAEECAPEAETSSSDADSSSTASTASISWTSLRSSGQRNSLNESALTVGGVNLVGALAVGLMVLL